MNRKALLLSIPLALSLGLCGCSGDAKWYQLDKFLSMEPSAIVNELEESQGLEYEGEEGLGEYVSYDLYVWSGTPSDPVSGKDENEILQIYKEDTESMSRDELLDGTEITGAQIMFETDAFNNGSVESTVDEIVKRCGFSDTEAEGMHDSDTFYVAAGPCQLNGQDAYWRVDIWETGTGQVSVFLNGDTDMLANISNNLQ